MRLSLWVLIFHRVDFSHFILLLSTYWILIIINQALSKTKELSEIESRYFASEEESHLTSIIYKCHIQPSGNARRVCNMFNELANSSGIAA